MSTPITSTTEQLIVAHLADPALVRALVEAHVLGLAVPCQGAATDGRCLCGQDATPPDFRAELGALLKRWDAIDRAAGRS
jgi:hypothetical protein